MITTNYVVAELAALLTSPLHFSRPSAISRIQSIKDSPCVKIVHVDSELDERAWKIFRRYTDKSWSWVDCVSFVVMSDRSLTEAWTTDHHFEQAGFTRLLEED